MNGNEKLGYAVSERLLIVNGDDFGMCHAANTGIAQLLAEGAISSSTVMIPCSWSAEAAALAAAHPQYDIGIHLTLTSEWEPCKWGPVQQGGAVDSLITPQGWFPSASRDVELHADPLQVRRELHSQVLRAMERGIDPTHLDNHMGSVYGLETGRDFLEEVLDVCETFALPFRLPRSPDDQAAHLPPEQTRIFQQRVASADRRGIMLIDNLDGLNFHLEPGEDYAAARDTMIRKLRSLKPGITEMVLHPFHVTEELKAITPQWEKRGMEFELFRDPAVKRVLKEEGIRMIGWRALRDAQRRMKG